MTNLRTITPEADSEEFAAFMDKLMAEADAIGHTAQAAPPRVPGAVRAVIIYDMFKPMDRDIADLDWVEGKTLAEYLGDLPEPESFTVFAHGREIPREEWATELLIPDDSLVVTRLPQGGETGRALAMVALVVVAVVASVYLGPIVGGALFSGLGEAAAVAAGTALVSGVVMTAGGMLLNTLMPVTGPKQNPSNTNAEDESQTKSYGLDGPKPTSREAIAVPVVYGEYRVGGNRINLYTENVEDGLSQDVYMQHVVSEGEVESVSNILVNDQPAENYRGVQTATSIGSVNAEPIGWFGSTIVPNAIGTTLTESNTVYNTTQQVDRLSLDITFPQGLFRTDTKTGERLNFAASFAAVATNLTTGVSYDIGMPSWRTVNLDGLSKTPSVEAVRVTVRIKGTDGAASNNYAYGITVTDGAGAAQTRSAYGTIVNTAVNVDALGATTFVAAERLDVYELSGTLGPFGVYISFEGGLGSTCEIASVDGLVRGNIYIERRERTPIRYTITSPPLPRASYGIVIRRGEAESTVDTAINKAVLSQVNEITGESIAYNRSAYYALKIRLTDQLSSIPTTTALVKGRKVAIYNSSGTQTDFRWSDNPADIVLDIMTSPSWGSRFSLSRIDFASFERWRSFCATNNLKFNGIFDTLGNVWDSILTVSRIGRASPIVSGTRWGMVIEGPATPTMMFGAQNIHKGTFKNFWLGREERANHIEAQYYDANDNFKRRSVFAIDELGIAAGDPMKQATLNLVGVTNPVQAFNEAALQLWLNLRITQGCSFTTGLEALGVNVGDVVLVQHDMPKWGWADRVKSVVGNVVTLTNPLIPAGAGPAPESGLGDPLPAGDWRMLIFKGALLVGIETVQGITGTGDTCKVTLNGVGSANRLKIGTEDYRVLDVVNTSGQMIFTVDRTVPSGMVGQPCSRYYIDVLFETTIERPNEWSPTVTITGSMNFAPEVLVTLEPDDQIFIGRIGKFKKPFRVLKVGHDIDHTFTLNCMEYDPFVYDQNLTPQGSYSEIPLDPQVTDAIPNYGGAGEGTGGSGSSNEPAQVTGVFAEQIDNVTQAGDFTYSARVRWTPPLNDPRIHAGVKVYVAKGGENFWLYETVSTERTSSTIGAALDETVRFKIVAFDAAGVSANYDQAPMAGVTISKASTELGIPENLTATGGIRQNVIRWTPSTSRLFAYAEVHGSATSTFAAGASLGRVSASEFIHTGLAPNVTRYYWVRFIDAIEQTSVWVGPVNATTVPIGADDILDGILDTAKFAAGLGPIGLVNGVPTGKGDLPDVIYDIATGLLYKWNGTAWVPILNPADLGQLIAANFPADLRPIERVTSMPTTGNTVGRMVYLTVADSTSFPGTTFAANKVYRWTGSAWTAEVPAADISGALAAANFPSNLRPVETVSAMPTTGNTVGRHVYLTATDSTSFPGTVFAAQKLYRWNGTAWTAAVDGGDVVAGTISANAIAANSILASKMFIGETGNAFPDYDMRDTAYYSGSAFTLAGSTTPVVGQNWLQIASSSSSATVQSAWFPLEASADYSASGAAWLASAGSTTATLSLELGSVDSAGVVTSSRTITIQTATNTTTPVKAVAAFLTSSSERRARFVMTKSSTSGAAVRFGGFAVRRRATGELIVDGSITTEKMNAGSINADRLVAGSVSASLLAADSVLASKIYIGESGNAFPDYDMEDAAYYSGGTFSFGQLVNTALGRQYLNIASSSSPVTVVSDWFPIEASADYSVYGASWISSAASTATALYVELGSVATNGTVTVTRAVTIQSPTSTTTPTRQVVNVTTASSEKRMRFNMQKSNISGAAARYGGFFVRRRASGELIVDGSITTAKLTANAVTANELAANAVVAGKIQAGAVNTNELAANAITAGKLATSELITLSAQIGDLKVITAKIGDDAVSTFKQSVVPRGAYVGGSGTGNFFWVSGVTFSVPVAREGFVLGYADIYHSATPKTYYLRIKVNGSAVFSIGGVNPVSWQSIMCPINLPAGSNTVEMEFAGEDAAVGVGSTGLIIFSRSK